MIQLLLSARTTINRTTPIWLPKIIVPSTILLIVAIPLTAVIIASMMGPSPAGTAIGTAIGGGGGIGGGVRGASRGRRNRYRGEPRNTEGRAVV